MAANVEPDVLLIDEVLSVGDEAFQRQCAEKIEQFRADGRTIIFVSHGLNQVEQLCERVAWIDHGVVAEIGPANEVITRYRGESHDAGRDETGFGARWGTRQIEITEAGFVDAAGAHQTIVTTLEPATLRIAYTSAEPFDDVIIGMRIDTVHGQLVWGTSTRLARQRVPRIDGPGHVDLHFEQMPLLHGVYDLSVSATDASETHVYDHWERRVRFEVRQYGTNDAGLTHIPVTWDLSAVTAAPS